MNQFDIDCRWLLVRDGPSQNYLYPQAVSKFIRESYTKAGVYRLAVYGSEAEPVRAYIGETENLASRIGQYIRGHPSQKQVFRVKHELLEPALKESLRIEFQVFDFKPFLLNGMPCATESLSSEPLRKMMQWFAIATHDFVHCELCNKILNPMTRRADKAKKLSAEQRKFLREEAKRNGSAVEKRARVSWLLVLI